MSHNIQNNKLVEIDECSTEESELSEDIKNMEMDTHSPSNDPLEPSNTSYSEKNLEEQLVIGVTVKPSDTSASGLCRCCLELTCHKSLWQAYSWMGSQEKYGEMLKECFSLDLSDQPNATICEVCITQLRSAVRFKAQVAECQEQWREQGATSISRSQQLKIEQTAIKEEHDQETDSPQDQNKFDDDDALTCVKSEDSSDDSPSFKQETVNKSEDEVEEELETTQLFNNKQIKRKKIIQIKSANNNRRTISFLSNKFTKPRKNVGLLLQYSNICPFKYSKGNFKCFYCTKNFLLFKELRSHVKKFHDNLDFKNIVKCVTRPNDYIKVDANELCCRICPTTYANIEQLYKHLHKYHEVAFDGNPTDKIIAYDLADNKFKCTICNREFLFFKTLSKHMNEHSPNHVCDACGKAFVLIERLKAHVEAIHSVVILNCDSCHKTFTSKASLNSHIRYVHEKKQFPCSICKDSFLTYRLRLKHFIESHGRAPLSLYCVQCNKNFTSNADLTNHVKNFHWNLPKEAKYTCDDCGRKFVSKHVLNGHMLVHTGEKNLECEVCKKKFGRLYSLKEHLKIHKNDKRWSCGACSVCFVQKCSLKNHIRVHHAEHNLTEDLIVYKDPNK